MKKFSVIIMFMLSICLVSCSGGGGADGASPGNGGDPDGSEIIYATGSIILYGDINYGYWKNGVWNSRTIIDNKNITEIYSLLISGSDFYAAGASYLDKYSAGHAGYSKNGIWVELSTESSNVTSSAISGSDVYTAGSIGYSKVCYWKNSELNILPKLDSSKHSYATSITVSGGDVYVAGSSTKSVFDSASGVTVDVEIAGYWKNGVWTSLVPEDSTKNSMVNSIVISGKDIYAAGGCKISSYYYEAGYWKNGEWNSLTPSDLSKDSRAGSIVISGDDVYVTVSSNNNKIIAGYWKNGELILLAPLDSSKESFVKSLVVSGSDVYAAGYRTESSLDSAGGMTDSIVAGYWKNGVWVALATPVSTQESKVKSLTIVSN